MIQYNNFLMKREQSRAGSRFAECEKSRLKAKILITLALLLTAVTGAWAEETVTVKELTASEITAWANDATNITAADLPGFVEATTEQAQSWDGYPTNGFVYLIYGFDNGEMKKINYNFGNAMTPSQAPKTRAGVYDDMNRSTPDRYFYVTGIEGGIEVNPVVDKTNQWTFSMPGSDVVLTPQYAPAAQLDKDGAPAAVSGLEIAADAAIITEGQSAQGTLLYAVTTSAEAPALTAFSAALPNAKDQTAAGIYYVWYYIQGHDTPDGQEPSADNTFNDSEIMGPVTVELLTNEHTLNIKQSPNITVTVAGTAKTPTDDKVTPVTTGQEVKIKANEGYKFRKVEVKKKAAAPTLAETLTTADMTVSVSFLVDGNAETVNFTSNGDGTYTKTGGTGTLATAPDWTIQLVENSGMIVFKAYISGFSENDDTAFKFHFSPSDNTYYMWAGNGAKYSLNPTFTSISVNDTAIAMTEAQSN